MDMKSFTESSWVRLARDPQTIARLVEEFPLWVQKIQDSELVARARRLWAYLQSDRCSMADVAMVAGVLLYLISPVGKLIHFISPMRLLVAGLVLAYLDRRANGQPARDAIACKVS